MSPMMSAVVVICRGDNADGDDDARPCVPIESSPLHALASYAAEPDVRGFLRLCSIPPLR